MGLQTGQILQQRYHVVSHIGQGGMGAVYQAQDSRLNNRLVAIKEFDPTQPQLSVTDRQDALQAFQQEAAILSGLSHPGLTAVYDYFLENNKFYLVMEFVQGETLAQAWQRAGQRFAEAQVVAWAKELCDVLGYLHSQQPPVIFRDLKPDNIIVQPNGRLKLIDFGIARHFTPGKTSDTTKFGTPGYAAPEQYGQGQTDARSDIYALGVVMHQLLSGYDPTNTPFRLPPLDQIAPHVSLPLRQVITQALEIEPGKRPSTVAAFSTAFHAPTIALSNNGQTDIPLWGWGLAAGLLLLLFAGVWLARGDQSTQTVTLVETVVVTQIATTPEDSTLIASNGVSMPVTPELGLSPTAQPEGVLSGEVIEPVQSTPSPTPTPTTTPTQTPEPTETITAVAAFRPAPSQTNMISIWHGLQFEDMQSPGTKRYNTTVSSNEARRWSFIWCGRTRSDLEAIVIPLTFSMQLNGEPINSSQLLEHDQVVNGWYCRYWSTLLQNWVSGQTVEVEANYHLSERIFDGENFYEPGTYRQIIAVRIR
jgi:serine/threonine protein kinase